MKEQNRTFLFFYQIGLKSQIILKLNILKIMEKTKKFSATEFLLDFEFERKKEFNLIISSVFTILAIFNMVYSFLAFGLGLMFLFAFILLIFAIYLDFIFSFPTDFENPESLKNYYGLNVKKTVKKINELITNLNEQIKERLEKFRENNPVYKEYSELFKKKNIDFSDFFKNINLETFNVLKDCEGHNAEILKLQIEVDNYEDQRWILKHLKEQNFWQYLKRRLINFPKNV